MNKNEAQHLADTINAWPFPHVKAHVSTLGGEERSSVMVHVSLDSKAAWPNGILQNSQYATLAFHSHGPEGVSFENLSGYKIPKIRAWKVADKAALYKKFATVEATLRKTEKA